MVAISDTIGPWVPFMKTIKNALEKYKLPQGLKCDHICYRVPTLERYEIMKKKLLAFGELAGEELVSGRAISIFELSKPLECHGITIDCIELPAPKEKNQHIEGLEHAEFIYHDLLKMPELFPNIEFETKSLNRDLNPELSVWVNDNIRIKFHPLHILDVLKIEAKL